MKSAKPIITITTNEAGIKHYCFDAQNLTKTFKWLDKVAGTNRKKNWGLIERKVQEYKINYYHAHHK